MLKRVFDLSGGMTVCTNRFLRASNELVRVVNYVNSPIGSLTKRYGYTAIGSQITDNYSILGNYEFQYGTAKTQKHVVVIDGAANAGVYDNQSGTWTTQSQSLTAGNKARMATFLDYLFLVNYADATRTWSGSAWSTSTNVTSAPKAKFIETYKERVFLGYINDGTAYPSRFGYSSMPTAGAITWPGDYLDVNTNDNDEITALSKNKQHLLIFKRWALFRYDGTHNAKSLLPVSWNVGTPSQESVVKDDNNIYFWSDFGPYLYDGASIIYIGRKIQDVVDRVAGANLTSICGGMDGNHIYWYLGDLSSALDGDSAALTKVMVDYDKRSNNWAVHTLQHALTCLANVTVSSKKVLTAGDNDGNVWRINSGTKDGMTSGGTGGTAITPHMIYRMWPAGPETVSTFNKIYFFGDSNLKDADFQYSVDGQAYSTAKDIGDDGDFVQFSTNNYGRQLDVKITESTSTNQYRIDGFSVELEPQEPDIVEA
jgi:hypothetical protein